MCCCGLVEMSKNPIMTLPIKKRINTELFFDEKGRPLYIKMRAKLSG